MAENKPPAGFSPVPGGKHGGYRKQIAGKWQYWYPDEASRVAAGLHHGDASAKAARAADRAIGTKRRALNLEAEEHTTHWEGTRRHSDATEPPLIGEQKESKPAAKVDFKTPTPQHDAYGSDAAFDKHFSGWSEEDHDHAQDVHLRDAAMHRRNGDKRMEYASIEAANMHGMRAGDGAPTQKSDTALLNMVNGQRTYTPGVDNVEKALSALTSRPPSPATVRVGRSTIPVAAPVTAPDVIRRHR